MAPEQPLQPRTAAPSPPPRAGLGFGRPGPRQAGIRKKVLALLCFALLCFAWLGLAWLGLAWPACCCACCFFCLNTTTAATTATATTPTDAFCCSCYSYSYLLPPYSYSYSFFWRKKTTDSHASIREAKQNNVNENVLETETKRPKSG